MIDFINQLIQSLLKKNPISEALHQIFNIKF